MRALLWAPLTLTLTMSVLAGTDLCLARIIDDFEDGDISDWMQEPGVTALPSPQAACEGSYGLEVYGGALWRDDDIAHVRRGGTLSCFTQLSSDGWTRNYLGFGWGAAGSYSAILGDNTDTFSIRYHQGYGYVTLAEVPYTFVNRHWYFLAVHWSSDGSITANLYDNDMTTLLATVTAVHQGIAEGGIWVQATGNAPDTAFWDWIRFEPDPVSGVGQETHLAGPTDCLYAGWPTPAQQRVHIRFCLAAATHARLEVLDAAGRRIRLLVDGNLPAGEHQHVWDATDDRECPVGTGVFWMQMRSAGGYESAQRLLLLR